MTSHTKGPWTFQARLSGSENHKGFRICGPEFYIALDVIPVDQDGKEGEANARLIAAAPDMVEFIERWTHDGCLQTFEDRERFRTEALSLLSKVTGAA